jgi:16S rRNA (adenine1518-N6/adenine1519-N6)-dimethyltransferase
MVSHSRGTGVSARRATRRQRQLGQNFLVDQNILDVIERMGAVQADDVVLEIGAGPGVLSVRLAALAGHLHAVEVDPRLDARLRDALTGANNVTVHLADALELDLSALDPHPTKIVANLPYAIAATAILRTIEELPHVSQWVVMVQREVGERLAATPGTSAYGGPSVLAQLACEVEVLRPVSRTVFRPVPNVDSVLLGLRRREAAAPLEVRRLVRAGFAHRRKPLASSLALAPDAPDSIRERARAALEEMDHPPDERAERLSPPEFRALAARLQER